MKKSFIMLGVFCAFALSSCKMRIVPQAINTVNSVSLEEMNLERKDYTVLNTISAEAIVTYKQNSSRRITIQEGGNEFKFIYRYHGGFFGKKGNWSLDVFSGVARIGYLDNDYSEYDAFIQDDVRPEFMARSIAIYRAINACKMAGGDGLIEPIISTNVEQSGPRSVTFKTTVSAKIIKLKVDGK